MNWKLRIDSFEPLSEEDLTLFAPPAEVLRAVSSYNEALSRFSSGKQEQAAAMIRQIAEDYPLFAQAGHLKAVLQAGAGETEEAEDLLRKVRLLELKDDEARRVDEEIAELRAENRNLQKTRAKRRRGEELLTPVKLEVAAKSILRRVPDDPRKGLLPFGKKEESPARDDAFPLDEAIEKRKTLRFFLICAVSALLVLLLFFFFIRPGIRSEQRIAADREARLNWLEHELAERGAQEAGAARLLKDYQDWLNAGKPEFSTSPESEENPSPSSGPAAEDRPGEGQSTAGGEASGSESTAAQQNN